MSVPSTSDSLASKESKASELFGIFLRYWRRNVGSRRVPIWKPLCTYVHRGNKYNYDLHWLDPNSSKDGIDGVSFYVTKYLLKYDDFVEKFKSLLYFNLSDSDFHDAWLKFKPRCLISKGFGLISDTYNQKSMTIDPLIANHIKFGIQFSLDDNTAMFPYYVSKQNGSTYPLAPYYARRFMTPELMVPFVARRPEFRELTPEEYDNFDKREAKFEMTKSFLRRQNLSFANDMTDINKIMDYGKTPPIIDQTEDFAGCWEDF